MHLVLKRQDYDRKNRLRSKFAKVGMSAIGASVGAAGALVVATGSLSPATAASLFSPFAKAMEGVQDMDWPDMKISYDYRKQLAGNNNAANDDGNGRTQVNLPAPVMPRGYDAEGKPLVDCSATKPILFRGYQHDVLITNPTVCYDLDRMLPANGETIQFSDQIKLTGFEFGAVQFQLNDMTPVVIPAERYRGFIEAWLVSGGASGQPMPAEYFFAKWHLESAFGQNMHNPFSSACGTNQFVEGTFVQVVDEAGRDHGYDREADMADGFARRPGKPKDYAYALNNPDYLQWFRQECVRPAMGMILGARHSIKGIGKLEELVNEGKITLPEGRTQLSATDAYIGAQLLGYGENGAQLFYRELDRHPHRKMKDILPRDAYARNAYFFEEKIPVIDRKTCKTSPETNQIDPATCQQKMERVADIDPKTKKQRRDPQTREKMWKSEPVFRTHYLSAHEFYYNEVATRWGFGHAPLPSMTNWKPAPYVASGTVQITPVNADTAQQGIARLQAEYSYIYEAQTDMRVAHVPRTPSVG